MLFNFNDNSKNLTNFRRRILFHLLLFFIAFANKMSKVGLLQDKTNKLILKISPNFI